MPGSSEWVRWRLKDAKWVAMTRDQLQSPRGSPCERVVREHRVVEDHGLGLAPEQADLQLVPEPTGSVLG